MHGGHSHVRAHDNHVLAKKINPLLTLAQQGSRKHQFCSNLDSCAYYLWRAERGKPLHICVSLVIIIMMRTYSCPSVTEGQWKRFDHETQDAESLGYPQLEARATWFLRVSVIVLAQQTRTLASWMDYTKTSQQWALTFSGPQRAKELH